MQSLYFFNILWCSDVVHELEPKKWVYAFLVTSGCLHSRNVLWAIRIGSFWPKIEVFYRSEWTKGVTTWKLILTIFSSAVNEAIKTNSNLFKKRFCNTKTQNKQKPINKIKQANIKQVRQQILVHKNLISGENWLICFFHYTTIFKFRYQCQKQLERTGKEVGKNRVICLVSMLSSLVMVLKLSRRVHFLQFCAELSKKSKLMEAIYIFAFCSYRKKRPWGY